MFPVAGAVVVKTKVVVVKAEAVGPMMTGAVGTLALGMSPSIRALAVVVETITMATLKETIVPVLPHHEPPNSAPPSQGP